MSKKKPEVLSFEQALTLLRTRLEELTKVAIQLEDFIKTKQDEKTK